MIIGIGDQKDGVDDALGRRAIEVVWTKKMEQRGPDTVGISGFCC